MLSKWWLFLIVGVVLYGSYVSSNNFFSRGQVSSGKLNNDCRVVIAEGDVACASVPLQWDKFILMVTDGLSLEYGEQLIDLQREHALLWPIDVPGPKYSHAVYSSHLNGQPPTNLAGNPITSDHLLASMVRAGMRLRYEGPEWSFAAVVGASNYPTVYQAGTNFHAEPPATPFSHAYPFFFEDQTSRRYLERTLEELVASNGSLIAHSGVFDHTQHSEKRASSGDDTPRSWDVAANLQYSAQRMMRFVKENPEYALIWLSDHGTDDYMYGTYRQHGVTEGNNSPFLMIFSPRIQAGKQMSKIDVVDVCPTIAAYLRGVDFPEDSLGVPSPHVESKKLMLRALTQLNRVASRRGVQGMPLDVEKLRYEQLVEIAQSIKSAIYQSSQKYPLTDVLLLSCVSVAALISLSVLYNPFSGALRIVAVYVVCFNGIFFIWWRWAEIVSDGSSFVLFSIFTPVLMLRWLPHARGPTLTALSTANKSKTAEIRKMREQHYTSQDKVTRVLFDLLTKHILLTLALWACRVLAPGVGAEIERMIAFPKLCAFAILAIPAVLRSASRGQAALGLALALFHQISSDVDGLYIVFGFHVGYIACIFYMFALCRGEQLLFLAAALLYHQPLRALAAMATLMWYQDILGPLVSITCSSYIRFRDNKQRIMWMHVERQELSDSSALVEFLNEQSALFSLAAQCSIVLLFNHIYYLMYFAFGDVVSLDAHVDAAALGVLDYNEHLISASAHMLLHKYFAVLVAAFTASAHLLVRVNTDNNNNNNNSSTTLVIMWPMALLTTTLWWSVSLVGYYVMLLVLSVHSRPDLAITSAFLMAAVTLLVALGCAQATIFPPVSKDAPVNRVKEHMV